MPNALFSDQPIRTREDDELDVQRFVQRLIRPLLEWPSRESLVVGLYAPWGAGKTSVLNLLEATLTEGEFGSKAVVARFNPWLYQDAETLLQSFFKTVQQVTKSTPLLSADRKKRLNIALDSISKFAVPVFGTLSRPVTAGQDFVTPASAAVMRAVSAALEGGEPRFEAQKKKAAAILEQLGTKTKPARMVVLIDDLDRAELPEVRAMLKLIRLIGDLPNITYVVAMDHARVAKILTGAGDRGVDASYLEKIIQIPLQVPPITPSRIRALLISGLDRVLLEASVPRTMDQLFEDRRIDVDELILWRVKTLRDRARLMNTYRFLLLSGGTALEVDPVDALLISFLRTFYPTLVERIHHNKDFLTGQHTNREVIRRITMKDDERKAARLAAFSLFISGDLSGDSSRDELQEVQFSQEVGEVARVQANSRLRAIILALFPYADTGYSGHESEHATWRRQNRIAAIERFDRYFDYGTPEDSFSDAEIDEWLETAQVVLVSLPLTHESESWRAVARQLFAPLDHASGAKRSGFAGKVLDRVEVLNTDVYPALGFAIAHASHVGFISDQDAAKLVRHLLNVARFQRKPQDFEDDDLNEISAEATQPDVEKQLHSAFGIILAAAADPFDAVTAAVEHVRFWVRRTQEESLRRASSAKLPEALDGVVHAGLDRIRGVVSEGLDVFDIDSDWAGNVIWRWRDLLRYRQSDYTEIKDYINGILAANPGRLPAVLGLFAGWSGREPSLTYKAVAEIRPSAEEIVGWRNLLRAVIRYRRSTNDSDATHDSLVPELERMLRADAKQRARERKLSQVVE